MATRSINRLNASRFFLFPFHRFKRGFRNHQVAAHRKTALFSVAKGKKYFTATLRFYVWKLKTEVSSTFSSHQNSNWPIFYFFYIFLETEKKAVLRRAIT